MAYLNKLHAFACDLRPDSGEGGLAAALLSCIQYNHQVVIYEDAVVRALRRQPLCRDRLLPIYLLVIMLSHLLRRKRVVLLNYVPIWNFMNAALARLGARLGPVTGSAFILPDRSTLGDRMKRLYLQRLMINIFLWFYPSERLIWAATPSVLAQLGRKRMPNVIFGFPMAGNVAMRRDTNKIFDIFIYSGHHPVKNHLTALAGLDFLSGTGYRICYVGPDFNTHNPLVSAFEWLAETEFDRLLSQSRLYLSFSSEDAGITGMKALASSVPVLCPANSGLAFMMMHDQDLCYTQPLQLEVINAMIQRVFQQLETFSIRAAGYFKALRDSALQSIEKWSLDL